MGIPTVLDLASVNVELNVHPDFTPHRQPIQNVDHVRQTANVFQAKRRANVAQDNGVQKVYQAVRHVPLGLYAQTMDLIDRVIAP